MLRFVHENSIEKKHRRTLALQQPGLDSSDKSEMLLNSCWKNCSELQSNVRTRAESWLQKRTERVALDRSSERKSKLKNKKQKHIC